MIILIGTGHVFDLSLALVTIFDEKSPDMVCVELDQQRYQALVNKKRNPDISQVSSSNIPFIYRLFARFQQTMAKQYGVNAGDEMLTAAEYAQSHQIPLELIDMDAQKLFIQMWQSMPLREKIKLIFSGFTGFFVSRKQVEKELKQYQNNFDKYIENVSVQFPTIKRVLIDKRNEHMVSRLTTLGEKYETVIACLGDGHIPGIAELLEDNQQEFEIIRLQDLQNIKPKPQTSSEASFSVKYNLPVN